MDAETKKTDQKIMKKRGMEEFQGFPIVSINERGMGVFKAPQELQAPGPQLYQVHEKGTTRPGWQVRIHSIQLRNLDTNFKDSEAIDLLVKTSITGRRRALVRITNFSGNEVCLESEGWPFLKRHIRPELIVQRIDLGKIPGTLWAVVAWSRKLLTIPEELDKPEEETLPTAGLEIGSHLRPWQETLDRRMVTISRARCNVATLRPCSVQGDLLHEQFNCSVRWEKCHFCGDCSHFWNGCLIAYRARQMLYALEYVEDEDRGCTDCGNPDHVSSLCYAIEIACWLCGDSRHKRPQCTFWERARRQGAAPPDAAASRMKLLEMMELDPTAKETLPLLVETEKE